MSGALLTFGGLFCLLAFCSPLLLVLAFRVVWVGALDEQKRAWLASLPDWERKAWLARERRKRDYQRLCKRQHRVAMRLRQRWYDEGADFDDVDRAWSEAGVLVGIGRYDDLALASDAPKVPDGHYGDHPIWRWRDKPPVPYGVRPLGGWGAGREARAVAEAAAEARAAGRPAGSV